MMFTSDQVFIDYAYTLIYGAVSLIFILGLIGMVIFIIALLK